MHCDRAHQGACDFSSVWVVATERPSDPTEIVSVMEVCAAHRDYLGAPQDPNVAPWMNYMLTTKEALEEYIESSRAAANKHLFLTI